MLRTSRVRADTTVVPAIVCYPIDSGLLAKAIRRIGTAGQWIHNAGHPSESSSGRDRWGGYGGVWARCGGNGWGECGEALGIFGWERLSMKMSSRRGDRRGPVRAEFAAVAEQGPEHVDEAAGERKESLAMDESFASLVVIELPGGPVGADAGQRGHVEHPSKSAIVAFRPVQVPADAARIPWHRHQSGVGRQPAGGDEGGQVPPVATKNSAPRLGPKPGSDSMIRAYGWPRKRSVIVLSMSLISRSRLSSLRASRLISSAVPASPGSATSCWSASVTAVAAVLVIPAGQAWFSTRWAVTPQQNSHIVPRPHPVCAGPDHGQDRSSSLRCGRSV